jgi:hypothetical protein
LDSVYLRIYQFKRLSIEFFVFSVNYVYPPLEFLRFPDGTSFSCVWTMEMSPSSLSRPGSIICGIIYSTCIDKFDRMGFSKMNVLSLIYPLERFQPSFLVWWPISQRGMQSVFSFTLKPPNAPGLNPSTNGLILSARTIQENITTHHTLPGWKSDPNLRTFASKNNSI